MARREIVAQRLLEGFVLGIPRIAIAERGAKRGKARRAGGAVAVDEAQIRTNSHRQASRSGLFLSAPAHASHRVAIPPTRLARRTHSNATLLLERAENLTIMTTPPSSRTTSPPASCSTSSTTAHTRCGGGLRARHATPKTSPGGGVRRVTADTDASGSCCSAEIASSDQRARMDEFCADVGEHWRERLRSTRARAERTKLEWSDARAARRGRIEAALAQTGATSDHEDLFAVPARRAAATPSSGASSRWRTTRCTAIYGRGGARSRTAAKKCRQEYGTARDRGSAGKYSPFD